MSTTVGGVELSPDVLRDARFTERFRGYDAAEVDAFLSEAAEALEELVAERSAPMAALAAEQARLAIEEVRQQTLEEVAELQTRRDELVQAIAALELMLADRRRGLVEALALIDAAGEPATDSGDGAAPEGAPEAGGDDEADAEGGDEAEVEGSDDAGTEGGDGAEVDAGEEAGVEGGVEGGDEAEVTDSFLARLERAAAESGESSG